MVQIDLDNLAAVLEAVAERFTSTAASTNEPAPVGTTPADTAAPASTALAGRGSGAGAATPPDALEGAGVDMPGVVRGPAAGMGAQLAVIDEQLQLLLETDVGEVADAAWLPVLNALEQLRRRLSAVYLRSLAAADQVHAATLSPLGTRSTADYLKHGAGIEPSRAKADLAAARALHTGPEADGALVRQARVDAGPLRAMAPALATGAITGAHVATGVGVLEKLPGRLLTETNTEVIGAFLVSQAPSHSTRRFAEIAAYLVRSLATGTDDFYDPEAFLRRKLTMGVDISGMVFGSYQLDPVAGAAFRAVLEPLSAPNPDQRTPDGGMLSADGRSPDQRRADAIVEMAQAAAAYFGIPGPAPATGTGATENPTTVAGTGEPAGTADMVDAARPFFPGAAEDDAPAREAAAAAVAEVLFGLPAVPLPPATPDGHPAGSGVTADGVGGNDVPVAGEATSCGPSKASRLRPGRRFARITVTTTFDQLRTTGGTGPSPNSRPVQDKPPDLAAFNGGCADEAPSISGSSWPVREAEVPYSTWPDGRSEAGIGWPETPAPEAATDAPWPDAAPDHPSFTTPGYPVDPSPSLCGQVGLINAGTLARFACDASFERAVLNANGVVLELGQAIRLATPAQRRAVSLRDGGCIRPGCNRPATWCDVHHVVWFSRGGPTDVSNLTALCPSCHSMVHAGVLEVIMIEGLPYVRYGPNARSHTSLNPCRGASTNDWIRNTYFDALNDAKILARTLVTATAA